MLELKDHLDPDLRKRIKSKKSTAVIPVGSIEQHGPHLPVSTDSDIVTEVAKRLCKKKNFLLMPTINYGVSFEHAPFFNASIKDSTLKQVLADLCDSLYSNGIKTVFILNGHHGNQNAIKDIPKKLKNKKCRVFALSYWHHMKREFDHAGFAETSLMLAISKNAVKMGKAKQGLITDKMSKSQKQRLGKLASKSFPKVTKNGVWGDPRQATRADGIKMLSEITKNLEKKCQTYLTGKNPKLHQ
jgi:creatinine amidohydrolase